VAKKPLRNSFLQPKRILTHEYSKPRRLYSSIYVKIPDERSTILIDRKRHFFAIICVSKSENNPPGVFTKKLKRE
jgi:hypothetical protein